jgi:7 transmembrane receptor (Secretin family).
LVHYYFTHTNYYFKYGYLSAFCFQQILCEASYVLLEYARTASFMWMFIEGFYLNNMVTGKF